MKPQTSDSQSTQPSSPDEIWSKFHDYIMAEISAGRVPDFIKREDGSPLTSLDKALMVHRTRGSSPVVMFSADQIADIRQDGRPRPLWLYVKTVLWILFTIASVVLIAWASARLAGFPSMP